MEQRAGLRCGKAHTWLRYAGSVATWHDEDEMYDVLEQAVIVIDERDLERSRRDPRVRAFYER
jgi:hypothetical protein